MTQPRAGATFQRWAVGGMVIALLSLLIALAALIVHNERATRQALADRFATRAALTVSFTEQFVHDLATRERQQAERLLAGPDVDQRTFESVVSAFDFEAAVLLDEQGNLLHVWPRRPELLGSDMTQNYPHLRAAVEGRVGVSGVVPSAAEGMPIAAVAVPFKSATGRRVFSGAFAPTASPLGAYLGAVVPIQGGAALVLDQSGGVLARGRGAQGDAEGLSDLRVGLTELVVGRTASTAVVAEVPGWRWRVIITAPTKGLYAPVAGARLAPWSLWAALAGFGSLAVLLFVRLGRARRDAAATARTDSLTNLPNRRAMQEALETAASLSSRHHIDIAALMIDIDWFKRINDTYGHDTGDTVIRSIASAVRATIRDSDLAARWGGEEFLVLLPHSDAIAATIVAERIRNLIAETVRAPGVGGKTVTVSIGVAALRDGGVRELIQEADDALYAAKNSGRNRVASSAASAAVKISVGAPA